MIHYFDIAVAKMVGVQCAVLFENIAHWVRINKANGNNFIGGRYWTYNSKSAFVELFPYMTYRQIEYALKQLIDKGFIMVANHNSDQRDRTLWYTLTDFGLSITENCATDYTNLHNGTSQNEQPLPYNIHTNKETTYINPSKRKEIDKEKKECCWGTEVKYIISFLNNILGTRYSASSVTSLRHIIARLNEGFTTKDFETVITAKYIEWGKDSRMRGYLRPETLFGTKFEAYLNNAEKNGVSVSVMDKVAEVDCAEVLMDF
jgi:uncharacterized phage protein (TIGR02220 family)